MTSIVWLHSPHLRSMFLVSFQTPWLGSPNNVKMTPIMVSQKQALMMSLPWSAARSMRGHSQGGIASTLCCVN